MKDTFIAGKAPLPPSIDYGFNQLRDPNKYNVERAKELLNVKVILIQMVMGL